MADEPALSVDVAPRTPPSQPLASSGDARGDAHSDARVPPRSLLCKHYANEMSPDTFDAAVQTLYTRFFNTYRKYQQAMAGAAFCGAPPMVSRDTQTCAVRNAIVQTRREAATQPARVDVVGSERARGEYTLVGRADRYEPSEHYVRRRDAAVVLVQSCWRRHKAILRTKAMLGANRERDGAAREEQAELDTRKSLERKYQLQRRICPRTAADFQVLYDEVSVWLRQQVFSIKEINLPPEAKQAAFSLLLEKETRLLQNIDLLKRQAFHMNREDRVGAFFRKIAAPRRWQLSDGSFVDVRTPYTLRAESLRDVYYALEESSCFEGPSSDTVHRNAGFNVTARSVQAYREGVAGRYEGSLLDQRLDVLLQVKWLCKEFDSELTREIISLIDREADLLARRRSQTTVAGLRRRILNLFLQFCETPEFNPQVLQLVSDTADIVFRPSTLPIIDFRSLSPGHRERLSRVKMARQRRKAMGSLGEARETMHLLAETAGTAGAGGAGGRVSGLSETTQLPELAGYSDDEDALLAAGADKTGLRLVHLNSPLRKPRRGAHADEDCFCDFPGVGVPLVSEQAFLDDGVHYVVSYDAGDAGYSDGHGDGHGAGRYVDEADQGPDLAQGGDASLTAADRSVLVQHHLQGLGSATDAAEGADAGAGASEPERGAAESASVNVGDLAAPEEVDMDLPGGPEEPGEPDASSTGAEPAALN